MVSQEAVPQVIATAPLPADGAGQRLKKKPNVLFGASIAGGSEVEGPKKTREAVRLGLLPRRARTKLCEKSMAARRPGRKMMTGERKKSSSRVSCHRPRDTAFIRRKCASRSRLKILECATKPS